MQDECHVIPPIPEELFNDFYGRAYRFRESDLEDIELYKILKIIVFICLECAPPPRIKDFQITNVEIGCLRNVKVEYAVKDIPSGWKSIQFLKYLNQ